MAENSELVKFALDRGYGIRQYALLRCVDRYSYSEDALKELVKMAEHIMYRDIEIRDPVLSDEEILHGHNFKG